jgi:spore maturation protein CgeD
MLLMTVTVLLTSYNAGTLLGRAIKSVMEQTFRDFELLILDDGSTDQGTRKILDWFEEAGPLEIRSGVSRFSPTPAERAATVRYATLLNWGAEHSAGDYLTFLCGDDHFMPDRLERMVAKIEEGHDVVYGPQLMLDESGREWGTRPVLGTLDEAYHKVDLNSVMVTRDAFDAVGGFPDRPATPQLWREADAHFWRRLTDAGYRFVPVAGDEPTDCKTYREQSVDARVIRGETPWLAA